MTTIRRAISPFVILALMTQPLFATCGGGGGGGIGGISSGGTGSSPTVYHVPWKVTGPAQSDPLVRDQGSGLVVLWFPTSPEEARGSSLLTSRPLSLWSSLCVDMVLITSDNTAVRQRLGADPSAPVIVLADAAGVEMGRVEASKGEVKVSRVEKLVRTELDRRTDVAKETLAAAKAKKKSGDEVAAVSLYTQVWEQNCLMPKQGKKAAKELRRMGHPVSEGEKVSWAEGLPDLSEPTNSEVRAAMLQGLQAELSNRLDAAREAYERAHRLDPADPVPLRYLGEFHRHHSGDWDRASEIFEWLVRGPADPLSRAVALHGLGKMTIHKSEFTRGLTLFEESIEAYPLALTYRNLAVYWNSEGEIERARGYVEEALALAPDDLYNRLFAATYSAAGSEGAAAAEELALKHEDLLEASYNLAAIHAGLGHREKALELLARHFFVYEQFDDVRAKEMKEARDDIVFAAYHHDPDFVRLTSLADGPPDRDSALTGR